MGAEQGNAVRSLKTGRRREVVGRTAIFQMPVLVGTNQGGQVKKRAKKLPGITLVQSLRNQIRVLMRDLIVSRECSLQHDIRANCAQTELKAAHARLTDQAFKAAEVHAFKIEMLAMQKKVVELQTELSQTKEQRDRALSDCVSLTTQRDEARREHNTAREEYTNSMAKKVEELEALRRDDTKNEKELRVRDLERRLLAAEKQLGPCQCSDNGVLQFICERHDREQLLYKIDSLSNELFSIRKSLKCDSLDGSMMDLVSIMVASHDDLSHRLEAMIRTKDCFMRERDQSRRDSSMLADLLERCRQQLYLNDPNGQLVSEIAQSRMLGSVDWLRRHDAEVRANECRDIAKEMSQNSFTNIGGRVGVDLDGRAKYWDAKAAGVRLYTTNSRRVFGLKFLDACSMSLTNLRVKVTYPANGCWFDVPGNGAYVAMTGGLNSVGPTLAVIECDPTSEFMPGLSKLGFGGVKCFKRVRRVPELESRMHHFWSHRASDNTLTETDKADLFLKLREITEGL